jgi:hypothetical protein
MQRLIRKQVYLQAIQAQRVRRRARAEKVAEAEIIRRALDAGLDRLDETADDQRARAFARLIEFATEVGERGLVAGGRRWTRDEIYERGSR